MYPISAADSVSPAIQRTRDFLFRPFRWGTYLKLGLVAIITEGLGANLHTQANSNHSSGHGPMIYSPSDIKPEWIAGIVFALLLAMVVSIIVFYLITRLRFAFFHCLTHNIREIGPGWRLYGSQALRFFGLNLAVGFGFLVLVVLIAIPFVKGFWRLFHETAPGTMPNIGLLLALVLPLIPIILLLGLAGFLADMVLRDWMLPHYALDDASAGEAWMEVWDRVTSEKRQFIVYALLRIVLPTIAAVAMFMVLLIPGIALAGAFGAFEYGIHSAFADSTGGAAVAGIALQVFFGVIAFGLALLVGICLGGPVSTGLREYALIFYGGHYRALGDLLYPPAASASLAGTGSPSVA
jgi:hypothetical protein